MTSLRKTRYGSTAALCLLTPLLCVAQDRGGEKHVRLLSFEVPESSATYPMSINETRMITGYYISKSGVTSGFVRDEEGHITTFAVPESVLTEPVSINTAGEITGYYQAAGPNPSTPGNPQGFIRSADGTITTLTGNTYTLNGLQPVSINVAGEIAGNFPDITFASNIFIRSASGVFSTTTLSQGAEYSTVVTGLNAGGAIAGYSTSGSISDAQGFLWDGQGPLPNPVSSAGLTEIDVPASTGTFPTALNAEEAVVGCYSQNAVYYDFVRYPDGFIKTLKIPGTVPGCIAILGSPVPLINALPPSITINDQGTTTGYYTDASKVSHGFVYFGHGRLTTFEHTGSKQTIPTSINNDDVITGYYSRGSEIVGFIREP
jgi:hypothetical protein